MVTPEQPPQPINPRVILHGRLVNPPYYRINEAGREVTHLNVSVRHEDKTKKIHHVMAYNKGKNRLADKAKELQTGQEVEIVGYIHLQTLDFSPKGKERFIGVIEHIYAAAIRTSHKDKTKGSGLKPIPYRPSP